MGHDRNLLSSGQPPTRRVDHPRGVFLPFEGTAGKGHTVQIVCQQPEKRDQPRGSSGSSARWLGGWVPCQAMLGFIHPAYDTEGSKNWTQNAISQPYPLKLEVRGPAESPHVLGIPELAF